MTKGTSNEGRVLLEEGKRNAAAGEWPAALDSFDRLISSNKDGTDGPLLAEAYQGRGLAKCRMSMFKEAASDYMHSLEICKAIDDKPKALAGYSGLGYVHFLMGDPNMAMEFYEKAHAMAKELNDGIAIGKTLIEMGNALNQAGRFEDALLRYKEAIVSLSGLPLNEQSGRAHYNIGDLLIKMGRLDDATGHLQEAIENSMKVNARAREAWASSLLALCHARKGQVAKARKALADSVERLEAMKDAIGLSQAVMVHAAILAGEGKFEDAMKGMARAEDIARGAKTLAMVGEVLLEKGRILKERGDREAAIRTYKEAATVFREVANPRAVEEAEEAVRELGS